MASPFELRGAGLGLRPELSADLLSRPGSVDLVEVVAEACLAQPQARREAAAMAELFPVIPHGVKLSLGSADGIEVERAKRLGELARELRAPVVSEHVAFVRGGAREIGHLTALPRSRAAVAVVARNVVRARRELPDVPLLLENVAWTVRSPGDEMDEASFHAEIAQATGCELLLDLGNLHANARNEGLDPAEVLDRYPLERVAMVHIAGGRLEGGFFFDTHADPVPEAVFSLLERLFAARGPLPVILERDAAFPPYAELEAEVGRARALGAGQAERAGPRAARPLEPPLDEGARLALLAQQERLALLLTQLEAPGADQVVPYGNDAIARTREVLVRKRVDDAMPLLPRLSARRVEVEPIALACVLGAPRSTRMTGIADAIRIARAAAKEARLSALARVDGLVLEARFSLEGHEVRPRSLPFFGRERLPSGRSVWALKGPGASSPVRLIEAGRRAP